jgi:hypothetical protein
VFAKLWSNLLQANPSGLAQLEIAGAATILKYKKLFRKDIQLFIIALQKSLHRA